MLTNILTAFRIAIQNIRANLLHTLLSTLGIVIGVAALVAILSLADGMEQYARDQITQTTSLKSISVSSKTQKFLNEIWVNVDNYPVLKPEDARDLSRKLDSVESINLTYQGGTILRYPEIGELGVQYYGVMPEFWQFPDSLLLVGRAVTSEDAELGRLNTVVNEKLALQLAPDSLDITSVIGTTIPLFNKDFKIVGIGRSRSTSMQAMLSASVMPDSLIQVKPAAMTINAVTIEAVAGIQKEINGWITSKFGEQADMMVVRTNEGRLDQAQKAMMVFRIVMGLITGISVLVGGIGIMNVLLISVTERTSEIGIRKAMGAKKRDIMMQFLSESVTVSAFGSSLGVLGGFGFMMAVVPLIHYFTEVEFYAAYTLSTISIVAVIALVIGVVFGTYPAMRAARLAPVEAIQRE